jgi:hypothetical protein
MTQDKIKVWVAVSRDENPWLDTVSQIKSECRKIAAKSVGAGWPVLARSGWTIREATLSFSKGHDDE